MGWSTGVVGVFVAFDFDGTLSPDEMIVALGAEAGVGPEVAAITRRAMNDEIGYGESLRRRVGLLEGLEGEAVQAAFESVTLRRGVADLLFRLDGAGHHTAIVTGGFERGVRSVLDRAGVTVGTVIANHLVVEDGALTGAVGGPLVEGSKATQFETVASTLGAAGVPRVAVGDGANDVPMLRAADYAIGFQPKAGVGEVCDVVVEDVDALVRVFENNGFLPSDPP